MKIYSMCENAKKPTVNRLVFSQKRAIIIVWQGLNAPLIKVDNQTFLGEKIKQKSKLSVNWNKNEFVNE